MLLRVRPRSRLAVFTSATVGNSQCTCIVYCGQRACDMLPRPTMARASHTSLGNRPIYLERCSVSSPAGSGVKPIGHVGLYQGILFTLRTQDAWTVSEIPQ